MIPTVEVRDFEARHFADPQSRGVGGHQERAVLESGGTTEGRGRKEGRAQRRESGRGRPSTKIRLRLWGRGYSTIPRAS